MHRFFCPDADFTAGTAEITDKKELHHLKNVLRLKEGGKVVIFDGKGKEAEGTITSIKQDRVQLSLKNIRGESAKRLSVILACAIPKKAKFETIIEKCTELGVDEIVPLKTQRSEVHLTGERAVSKSARYQTVAVNAAKQCARKTVPKIHPITNFENAILGFANKETACFIPCLPGQRQSLNSAMGNMEQKYRRFLFLIGPEGDFTEGEINLATAHGCVPVSLGETVLKVDTAAIAVVAMARFFFLQE